MLTNCNQFGYLETLLEDNEIDFYVKNYKINKVHFSNNSSIKLNHTYINTKGTSKKNLTIVDNYYNNINADYIMNNSHACIIIDTQEHKENYLVADDLSTFKTLNIF
jgi:hypothetical protein